MASGGRVLQRVVEQILQHLLQAIGVAAHGRKSFGEANAERELPGAALNRAVSTQDSITSDRHGPEFELQLSGFDARKLQQVFGQAREASGVIADDLDEALAIGRVVQRAAQQRFRKALNGGERGAKFVRDIGDEILPDPFQAPQLADLVQHQNGAVRPGGAHRRRRDGKASRPHGADDDLAGHLFVTAERHLDDRQQVRLPHDFDQRASFDLAASSRPRICENARFEKMMRSLR